MKRGNLWASLRTWSVRVILGPCSALEPAQGLQSSWCKLSKGRRGEREVSMGSRDFLVLDWSQLESISFYRWGTKTKQFPWLKIIKLEIHYILQNSINSWIFCVHISKYSCSCFCVEIWLEIYIFIYTHLFSSRQPKRLFWSTELIKLFSFLNSLNGSLLLSERDLYFLLWLQVCMIQQGWKIES